MSDLVQRTQQRQAAAGQTRDRAAELVRTIQSTRGGVSAALAGRIDPDQFLRALATDIRKTPKLAECEPETVLAGMFTAAQMGLEIGSHRGHAYLVPYRNKDTGNYEASLIFGYKGYVELFYRAGARSVQWFLVREGDLFRIGSDPRGPGKFYTWEQADPNSQARVTGAVAQVVTANGGIAWEYLSRADIDKRATDTPFWRRWWDEMALKTPMRRLVATAPLSTDLRRSAEVDETVLRRIPGEEQPVARHLPMAQPSAIAAPPPARSSRGQASSEPPRAATPPADAPPPPDPEPEPPIDEAEAYEQMSAEEYARHLDEQGPV